MNVIELRNELRNHLVALKIPRTIEPNPNRTTEYDYSVSHRGWEGNPMGTLTLLKLWLNDLARLGQITEYHTIRILHQWPVSLEVTLLQSQAR